MLDILITGCRILDGTGAPAFEADIGITGDTITAVGDLSGAESHSAFRIPNSAFVTPGFIDSHSHSDVYLLVEPSAESKVSQGITTEVVGNCGASAAPLLGEYRMPADWLDKGVDATWHTVAEYRSALETAAPAVNVVFLVGHNTVRAGVMGYRNRSASSDELALMCRNLEQALDEGARGVSSGLIYSPGMFAPREELVALARVAAKRGGIYTSHMRSESRQLIEALEEALSVGEESGVRVQVSHLKTSGRANWHLVDDALALLRGADQRGVDVAADRYPYMSGYTDLDIIFPEWAREGGREVMMERLRNPAARSRLKEDLEKVRSEGGWQAITIGSTTHPENASYRGMPLVRAAEELSMDPADAVLHFAETDELRTSAFFAGMSEENMLRILAEPYVMIGTDSSLRATSGPLSTDFPHPRAYGAFPRFLRMAIDGKTVSLPEAIRKITSLPAAQFGLEGRGRIEAGAKADLVIFDAQTVCDTADYSNPHQLARGIEHVIVNGVMTWEKGASTEQRAGRFL